MRAIAFLRLAPLRLALLLLFMGTVTPAAFGSDRLRDLLSTYHRLRIQHEQATKLGSLPASLDESIRKVVRSVADVGRIPNDLKERRAVDEFFPFRILEDEALQVILVEGIVARDSEELTVRVFRIADKIGDDALLLFFEALNLKHLTAIGFDDLTPFATAESAGRRNAAISLLGRIGTPAAVRRMIECAMRTGEKKSTKSGVQTTNGHLQSRLTQITRPDAIAAAATALTEKPRHYARKARAFGSETKIAVLLALGHHGYSGVTSTVVDLLADRDLQVAIAAARALGGIRDPDTYEKLEKQHNRRKSVEFRIASLDSLAAIDAPKTKPLLIKRSRSKSWPIRSAAAEGLGTVADLTADSRLLELISDGSWQVRKASFDALEPRPSLELIDALMESLELQRGALRVRIYQALIRWTGRDFGYNPELWRDYWKAERGRFSFANRRVPRTRVRPGDPSRPRYFGLEIASQDFAFVIDCSGSMRNPYTFTPEGASKRRVPGIDLVREQLWDTLQLLKPEQVFNVVTFSNSYQRLFPKPTKASRKSLRTARRFLNTLEAAGSTNVYDPLEALIVKGDVETIYLLSDGMPTAGRYTSPKTILAEVRRLNRVGGVTIHCIALGHSSEFLKKLAEENGGTYKRADSED